MADLLDYIDWSRVECLNCQPSHPVQNALKQGYREDDGLYTQSDTDEQLLIHIAFNTATRLSGLVIKSADDTGKAPKFIKLFVNHPTIGFSEASDSAGLETFELNDGNLSGEPIPLKPVKFSRVNVLTIFIESNRGMRILQSFIKYAFLEKVAKNLT